MGLVVVGLAIAVVCSGAFATTPTQRTLSFDDRVRVQAAIERVYYSHQLGATKSFDDAMPKAELEAKVRKYLEQTAALNLYWKTAVTDEMLQRELERMAHATKMPERLLELYAALGDDPFIIKECLARATLVDRLTHNFYAFDSTLHRRSREQAEQLQQQLVSGELSPLAEHANRTVHELVVAEDAAAPGRSEDRLQKRLTLEEFQKHRTELPTEIGQVSDVEESRDAFAFNVVLTETATEVRVATYVVPKTSWDAWWAAAHNTTQAAAVAAVASDRGPLTGPASPHSVSAGTSSSSPCTPDDTWDSGSLSGSPTKRSGHTAIWTGSVMVVWGNSFGSGLGDGGRYDPATDTWSATSTVGAPSDRSGHTAVWTGSLMVVWGGDDVGPKTGGRYDPLTDTWRPMSTTGAPTLGSRQTAVWTGSVMVIWGGGYNTGGRYDPVSDTWTPTSTTGAPSARSGNTAVWTGSLMIVWGGYANGALYTGGRYDPVTDSWEPTSTTGTPGACGSTRTAVWTGNLMVLWCTSVQLGEVVKSGARYDPLADAWAPMSTLGGFGPRAATAAVWTGTQLVIYGGAGRDGRALSGGARYDPVQDAWTPVSGGAGARQEHSAIWTGTHMIVWGGSRGPRFNNPLLDTGGRYDPATDSWTPTSTDPPNAPAARTLHTAVWTGNLMVVWGGSGNTATYLLNSGGRYDPATDSWTPTSMTNAPAARASRAEIWTGSEMLVWGGYGLSSTGAELYLNTGARYDPMIDRWTPISLTGAPTGRHDHTAIWTGSVMVVWGGLGDPDNSLDTGGRYDPATDTWTPTSTDPSNAPSARYGHTAVWTGSRMVVWGGYEYQSGDGANEFLSSGGRYDPTTDSWTPTSLVDAPTARYEHTAVWTGSSMVVWGGTGSGNVHFDTGGMYDLANDSWTPTATTNAPDPRYSHTAVWTGDVMVIWGGGDRTGGRYDPITESWTPTSVDGAPSSRFGHSALWTGTEMIVWGGADNDRALGTGGRYVVVTSPTADRDCDGLSAIDGDCDDTQASVYPAAPQICDGRNNDCNDPAWPLVPPGENNLDEDAFLLCAGDCDDARPAVYPGADESCNGLDDDCDGVVDGGAAIFCDDGNYCTDDSCNGAAGCVAVPIAEGFACDDESACTTGDICSDGTCSGTMLDCDDWNICTDDGCYASSGCFHSANVEPCDDGNLCTGDDFCSQGVCNAGAADGCDDGNPCTDDTCESSITCSHINKLGPCDDENQCTLGDTCVGGACLPSEGSLLCDDHNLCTIDFCNPAIGCVFGDISNSCNDGNPCTDDSCDPLTGCFSVNANNACTDGNRCTAGDYCIDGACIPGPPLVCHDNNACTNDLCDPVSGCSFPDNANPCSDGNRCTKGDFCEYGACQAGAPAICNDFNPCTTDSCDHVVGCVFANHTFSCDDQSVCTTGDACRGGRCEGTSVNCDDANPCTNDSCHPVTRCFHTNNTNACDDGNLCTTSDKCGGGECRGTTSDPKPKSSGYYKTLCEMRERNQLSAPGDQFTDADAACVGELTATFAGIATTDDICDVIHEDHHGGPGGPSNSMACNEGEDELIATALNICRGRVCEGQGLDSRCNGNAHTTVSRSFADADAILDDAARTQETCRRAACELREINDGHALDMNSAVTVGYEAP